MALVGSMVGLKPGEKYIKTVNTIGEILKSAGVEFTEKAFLNLWNGGKLVNRDAQNRVLPLYLQLRRMGEIHGFRPRDIQIIDGVASLKTTE